MNPKEQEIFVGVVNTAIAEAKKAVDIHEEAWKQAKSEGYHGRGQVFIEAGHVECVRKKLNGLQNTSRLVQSAKPQTCVEPGAVFTATIEEVGEAPETGTFFYFQTFSPQETPKHVPGLPELVNAQSQLGVSLRGRQPGEVFQKGNITVTIHSVE